MPPERIHPALSRPRTRLRPLSKDQFAPAPQGQGYAREALRAVLEYAFEPPDGLDRVAAIIRPENERSRALLRHEEFVFSGEYRTDGAGRPCEWWFATLVKAAAPQRYLGGAGGAFRRAARVAWMA